MSPLPEGLDPTIQTREIVFEADASLVTPFLKLATVSRSGQGHMTFASDEGPASAASARRRRRSCNSAPG
jgi:hypothetical protein